MTHPANALMETCAISRQNPFDDLLKAPPASRTQVAEQLYDRRYEDRLPGAFTPPTKRRLKTIAFYEAIIGHGHQQDRAVLHTEGKHSFGSTPKRHEPTAFLWAALLTRRNKMFHCGSIFIRRKTKNLSVSSFDENS